MKRLSLYTKKLMLLIILLVVAGNTLGQEYDSVTGKEIIPKDAQQRALVAPDCMIPTMWKAVSVIGGNKEMNNFLDTDLTNSVKFQKVVEAELGETEIIRVKDRKHVYEKGTPVGFCLDLEGGAILKLDVLNIYNILYYYDGKLVGSSTASSGDTGGSLLDLDLIQLPSTEENPRATTIIMATEPNNFEGEYFDEIALSVGGAGISLLGEMSIRYAFAGVPQEITLTEDNKDNKLGGKLSIVEGTYGEWNLQFYTYNIGGWGNPTSNFIDSDITNHTSVGIIDVFGSAITLKWGKSYPAGTEVGFCYAITGLAELPIGPIGNITLFDENGGVTESIDLQGSVLGLGLFGSSTYNSSVVATKPFCQARFHLIGGLKVSGSDYYYGYLREQPIIPSQCYIEGLSMDASICDSKTSYQLYPKEGVSWSFVKATEGKDIDSEEIQLANQPSISPDAIVSGLTENGYYHFTAKDSKGCEGSIVLKRGIDAPVHPCNEPITTDEYEFASKNGFEGGISLFDNVKNRDNILDDDIDSYATCEPGIGVLQSKYYVGVKKKNGSIGDNDKQRRIGFLVSVPTNVLKVSVLNFFYIKLYKNGEPLDGTYTVKDWNVISAGLIGTDNSSKMRLGVTIPEGIEFDGFALWSFNVVDVDLSVMHIHSAFVEDPEVVNCDDPLYCDVAYVGGEETEFASINYNATSLPSIGIGVGIKGLDNILSGELNPEKYAQYVGIASLLDNTTTIAIKFNKVLSPSQQAGFVVSRDTYLAGVNLLGSTSIRSYLNGDENEEDAKTNFSVLGVDVIGYGDYAYLMFNPTQPYDEIRLEFYNVASLLDEMRIYSLFIRNDSDSDGIPDCIDPTPCEGGALSSVNLTSGICEGDEVTLTGLATFNAGETKAYTLTVAKGSENPVVTETLNIGSGVFEYTFNAPDAGIYTVTLVADEGTADEDKHVYELKIHPGVTTWYGNATDPNDWNNWDNWSNGSPWSCTNVIIPTYSDKDKKTLISNYPILKEGDFNPCNYIHFEPHAEVVNTPYLTYNKAWVEIELKPNRYYMVATPIKGIYSGDWFISKEGTDLPDYFTELTEENYPANRVTPTIYQRVWEHEVSNMLKGQDGKFSPQKVEIGTTKWTAPYNHLRASYEKVDGYDFNALSVWVHPLTPDKNEEGNKDALYRFRFPKTHDTYFYSDPSGSSQDMPYENLKRDKTTAGRFIYEDENGEADFPITMTYNNEEYGEDPSVFLVGNPFMSHIDIKEFFEENKHIDLIKVYDGSGNNSIIYDDNKLLYATKEGPNTIASIPPMQSFFVELSSTDEYNDKCSITYTEDMLTQQPGVSGQLRSSSPSDALYLSASASGQRSSAMLRFSASASDYYHEGEDADILIDDEVPPAVAVFTVADSHALDIQQRASGGDIPIGFVLPKADEVTLRIDVPEEYAGWVLNDLETGKNYALRSGTNELELGRMLTNIGRFSLRGSAPTGNEVISASQPRIYCFREEGGNTLVVRSAEGMMARCEIYTLAGQLSGVASYETNEYRLPVPPGIKIVKVHFTDGITSTIKTY